MNIDLIVSLVLLVSCLLSSHPEWWTKDVEKIKLHKGMMALMWTMIVARPMVMVPLYFGMALVFSLVFWKVWNLPNAAIIGMVINVWYFTHIRKVHTLTAKYSGQ